MSDPEGGIAVRLPIESIILPFLGSRTSDYQPFEYLLQDVSSSGVRISIPSWVAGRERINLGDRINLHVPFELDGKVLYSGIAARQIPDDDQLGQVVGIKMEPGIPLNYPVFFSVASRELTIDIRTFKSDGDLLVKLAKDAYLLKKGCLIYLKHLSAFFSRLSNVSREEYLQFRDFVFDDIIAKTKTNLEYLSTFHQRLIQAKDSLKEAGAIIDLSELRQAVEPEMYVELFTGIYGDSFAMRYLYAIKELEGKLFMSYNTMVLVYCGII